MKFVQKGPAVQLAAAYLLFMRKKCLIYIIKKIVVVVFNYGVSKPRNWGGCEFVIFV